MTDRGQSEVVGFVLVFGLIVSTVALASVAGFGGLQDARDHERTQNAERAFDRLAAGIDDVVHEGAPSRAVDLSARSAQVFVGDPVTLTVALGAGATHEYVVHPLVYRGPDGTELVYVAGAVIRVDDGGAVMLREPRFMISEHRTAITIIETRGSVGRSVGGDTVTVRADGEGEAVDVATTTTQTVSLTVESPRAAAWERGLESNAALECTGTDAAVTCEATTEATTVTVSRIGITLT